MRKVRRLPRSALPADTAELARYLIGKTLVHDTEEGRTSGRIVETEAYVVGDAAGHAYRGQTQRNRSLFLRRGHAYVYFIYGVSYLLNVSSEEAGIGAGVLLRALEPLEGIEIMQQAARHATVAGSRTRSRPADHCHGRRHRATTVSICARAARCGWGAKRARARQSA